MRRPNNNETIHEKSEEYLECTISVRDSKLSKNSEQNMNDVKNQDGYEQKTEVDLNDFNSKNKGENRLLVNVDTQVEKNEITNKVDDSLRNISHQ